MSLPTLGADLNIPEASLAWPVSAYSLTAGCFLLFFGRIADLMGRRVVFLAGTTWLAVWALACGFAPNEISLDIFRALQGLGTAAAIPSALGILAESFAVGSTRRTIAFATFSSGGVLFFISRPVRMC